MPIPRRSLLLAATALAMASGLAQADTYPSKPVRVIVPFAPGGTGMELAAQAAPDGYTAFLGNVGTLAINPAIFGKSQRVTAADLQPVSLVANAPDIMVAHPSVPAKTVAEFVEHARKTPGMSFASPGSGSLNRLEMELFRQEAKLDMTHVPYKGGAGPAITDIVGGHVPVMFVPVPAAMQLIKAGKLKPIAVASAQRLSTLPEVPTLAESGFPKVVGGSWQALMFPKDTPQPVIARWHEALMKVLAREDVKADLLKGGVETATSASPKELADFIQDEAKRWGTVARLSNATAD